MKMISSCVLVLFALVASASSQDAKPTPTPPPADNDVVKITTNLIQVDITVTDRRGNVIRDLKPEEVEIYENGKKQRISNFSFISSVSENNEAAQNRPGKQPAPILPPSPIKPEQVHRTIALIVDDLTLSFQSVYYVRRALKKFVDEQMLDGDLVAIIRTGAGIGALQQFTIDKRQLYAAIDKIRWNPTGAGGIGAFAPLEAKLEGEEKTEDFERENNDFRESVFATGTLGAINYVVRGMQELPGRKSILLLSDGFKLFTEDASGFKESGRVMDSLRRLVDQANRASVVIYTMDARGLQYTGLTAADNTAGRTAADVRQAMSDRRDQLFDTQAGLQYLAKQTGGTSMVNNNDLGGGIRKILDDQSYYLLAYEPDEATFDPKIRRFNSIDVKVLRQDTRVRYRSGFFGISDEKLVKPTMTPGQRLLNALTSPFGVNEVAVRLNALFGNDVKQGSFIRSLLHVRAQDLKFTDEPDGGKKAVFDVLAVAFGDNGVPIDQISKTYTIAMKQDFYDLIMREGFVYDFSFPIKKPGAYQLRVALRDHGGEKIGSASQFVEVPNLKKGRLMLSGVYLENLSVADWNNFYNGSAANAQRKRETDPLTHTSLRQFKRGTVLNYGFTVFNAKLDPARKPSLSMQIKVFRDAKSLFEGAPKPVPSENQSDLERIGVVGSLSLGTGMLVGDYVMEIDITDNLAKDKRKLASQFVQFEIVE